MFVLHAVGFRAGQSAEESGDLQADGAQSGVHSGRLLSGRAHVHRALLQTAVQTHQGTQRPDAASAGDAGNTQRHVRSAVTSCSENFCQISQKTVRTIFMNFSSHSSPKGASVCAMASKSYDWDLSNIAKISPTSRERPKSSPYLRLNKTRKPLFLQLETTEAPRKLKIWGKIFQNFFFEFFLKSPVSRIVPKNVKGGPFGIF